jgi:hypothetical protein
VLLLGLVVVGAEGLSGADAEMALACISFSNCITPMISSRSSAGPVLATPAAAAAAVAACASGPAPLAAAPGMARVPGAPAAPALFAEGFIGVPLIGVALGLAGAAARGVLLADGCLLLPVLLGVERFRLTGAPVLLLGWLTRSRCNLTAVFAAVAVGVDVDASECF